MLVELGCCGLYVGCSVLKLGTVGYGSERCRPFKHRVCIILHPEKDKGNVVVETAAAGAAERHGGPSRSKILRCEDSSGIFGTGSLRG